MVKIVLEREQSNAREMDSSEVGIILCDLGGKIVYIGNKAEEWFALGEMTGRNLTDLTQSLERYIQPAAYTLTESIQDFLRGEMSFKQIEFSYARTEERLFSLYLTPVMNSRKMKNHGILLEFRACSAEEQMNRMRIERLGIVTHEIRAPLMTMMGYVEMLMQHDLSEKNRMRFLEIISAEGNRLSNLLDDLLDIEQMESLQLTYHKTYVSLVELVQKMAEQWNLKSSHYVYAHFEVEDAFVYADQSRLIQVLYNLLSNAKKYSPGQNRVDIHVGEDGPFFFVEVKDYGMGIPEELHERLFTKYYRVEQAGQIQGRGLGLYISKQIVEDHEGSLSVTSVPEQGSVFRLCLPKPSHLE
ncbi:PAS domain-containing sensor histidine kinase [Paenibacillus sp. HW567]|uniref:PAS domain-containing sensor histidine kinase n=1 Tax=Paenibacillus sp. HW567 TaxID=1034769 RepID=UPI000364A79F|nr:HAMP domain-containing sensor histidine kinase [Paenibacillus sp. HW567]